MRLAVSSSPSTLSPSPSSSSPQILIRDFCDSQTGRWGGNPGGGRGRRWQPSSQVQFDLNSQPEEVVLCNLCVPQVGGVLLHPQAGVGHPCRHDDRQVQAVNKQSSKRNWIGKEYIARTEHGLAVINGIPTVCALIVKPRDFVLINDHRPKIKQIKVVSRSPYLTASKGCNHCTAGRRLQNCND